MFLRRHQGHKDGKEHGYWSLVETVRTPDGPRQRTLCYLGELNSSAHARWQKSIEVFNEEGESHQLKLFPSDIDVPEDDPNVARVLLNQVRLERSREFGNCFWDLSCGGGLDWMSSSSRLWTRRERMWSGREWRRCWGSTGCALLAASWRLSSDGTRRRPLMIC